MSKMKKITGKALFLPIFCMLLVMLVNVIYDAASGNFAFSFFSISVRNGVLYGRLIDILNRGNCDSGHRYDLGSIFFCRYGYFRWFRNVIGSFFLLYAVGRIWSGFYQ